MPAPTEAHEPTGRRLVPPLLEPTVYQLSHDLGVVDHGAPPACGYRFRIGLRTLSPHRADALFATFDRPGAFGTPLRSGGPADHWEF